VDRDQIAAFLRRPRGPVDDLKAEWWAMRSPIEAGHELWEHARRVHPDFPSADDRADDLAHHIDLKRRMDRASKALIDR
jgi:hypothetical protein